MYGIKPRYNEPRYNEFFGITNIIRREAHCKRKIYLDITNYNVNARRKIKAEQINSQYIFKETAGADLGGGCRGCAPPPPEIKFRIYVFTFKNFLAHCQ